MTDKERFGDVSAEEIRKLVHTYFPEKNESVRFLEDKAKPQDAQREVRMVLWEFVQ